MFQLDDFIANGHQKVMEHYRRLRDTSNSEVEREKFERRMMEEYEALRHYTQQHRTRAA